VAKKSLLGGHFESAISYRRHQVGQNVNVSMMSDLAHVVAREKARMGITSTPQPIYRVSATVA
jgi:hypothetical protein